MFQLFETRAVSVSECRGRAVRVLGLMPAEMPDVRPQELNFIAHGRQPNPM